MDPYEKLKFEMAVDAMLDFFPKLAELSMALYKSFADQGFKENQALQLTSNYILGLIKSGEGNE